ncbi:HNH endonuclease [Micromonospora zhanjiangensis]|uniref:HNH endonuclease n=1 Tax=Micromonospora zhanjiangensis TaxID=1522057 RepID=A0ABV8KMM9_9ACTN
MTAPGPGDLLPGARFAMGVIHPGSPTLQVRYRPGVLVDPAGFPVWSLCARAVVELPPPEPGLTLDEIRVVDVLAANALLAATADADGGDPLWAPTGADGQAVPTPAGWCWAHVGNSRRLALVPAELHGSYLHAGGITTLPVTDRGLRVDAVPEPVGQADGDEVPDDVMELVGRMLGWPLPPAYQRFLAATNGAGPAEPAVLPGHGFVADQPLFGLAREDRHQDLTYALEWVRDRLTVDFLPIGYVQGGLLAVKVSGDDLDSVWYWDDDDPRAREAFGPDYISTHLLHRCADTIDDFWSALTRPARPLLDLAQRWAGDGLVSEVRDEATGAGLPAKLRPPWQPVTTQPYQDPLTRMFEAR